MRRLNRDRIPPPESLTSEEGEGKLETVQAIGYFSDLLKKGKGVEKKKDKKKEEGFEFKAYASKEVKEAVSNLSYNKCAYCEIKTLAGYDGDIEHFRPKGAITVENSTTLKPGYYWLAADWRNLFLSCQHSNQSRKQPIEEGKYKTMGKKNQFPVDPEDKRVRSHSLNIEEEEAYRLLIDPARENPLDFLYFDEKGMIYPRKKPDGKPDRKGLASIEVFALYRKHLVEVREEEALKLMNALRSYEDDAKELDENINVFNKDFIAKKKARLEEKIQQLKLYTDEDKTFSGMAYYIVKEFLEKRGIKY